MMEIEKSWNLTKKSVGDSKKNYLLLIRVINNYLSVNYSKTLISYGKCYNSITHYNSKNCN